MSICDSGIGIKVLGKKIEIDVADNHPLIVLANALPWYEMLEMILPDLKQSTPCRQWTRGRKLRVRIHLGAYILQTIYDLTDRDLESGLKENGVYQLFCGREIVARWHCPDHTKIEAFRSRLSPETQHRLANLICQQAVSLGLANPGIVDIDSTVQESNMTYPTDAKMLRKLGNLAGTVAKNFENFVPGLQKQGVNLTVNVKEIASKARSCFFLKKKEKASIEEKSRVLTELWQSVSEPVLRLVSIGNDYIKEAETKFPWHARRALNQLLSHGENYLKSVKYFIDTGRADTQKRLSFHLSEVSCFNKNKEHKRYEFGRGFQLVRLAGNVLFIQKSSTVRMEDKETLGAVIETHEQLFGEGKIDSLATDKGYYSQKNMILLREKGISTEGFQQPDNIKTKNVHSDQEQEKLRNRRAGIEPLIGHIKCGGQLGRSRMKNDRNTESSAYASVLGFNLRQISRMLFDNDITIKLLTG